VRVRDLPLLELDGYPEAVDADCHDGEQQPANPHAEELHRRAVEPQKLNGSISDSSWDVKKTGMEKNSDLVLCAGVLPSMQSPLASDVWNE